MKSHNASFLCMILLFLLIAPPLRGDVSNPMEARDLVVSSLLDGDLEGKRILVHPDRLDAGFPVESWHHRAVTTPSSGYVVFIDDMAFANFAHPCRYVFVDEKTGSLTVHEDTTPPRGIEAWLEMETQAYAKLMAARNIRAPRAKKTAPLANSGRGGELYAVLMNGGASKYSNHVRYWNDLSNIYITLVDVYGYKDDNIIVLCSDGLNPAPDQSNNKNSHPDLDGDGDDDIMYSATLANVKLVFDQLKTTLTLKDQLFFFATDHGSSNGGWSVYMNLWNYESLQDWELEAMMAALPQCNMISTLEPCYSGGFMDNLGVTPGRVFSSACAYDEVSWGMPPDYLYDTYVFFWTAAVKGEDAYGKPCDADLNGDDLISMWEAFKYAKDHDFSNETPQYKSTPPELGDELTLFGSAKVLYVPEDYTTIQAAIDAAEDMYTIRVKAGTYQENLDFLGKEIIVESLDGPLATVIDGQGAGSVVVFTSGETEEAVLQGFTLKNGGYNAAATGTGSGIYCLDSSPMLIDNIIKECGDPAHTNGGGIGLVNSSAAVINCAVTDNEALEGGGIFCANSLPKIINTTIIGNSAAIQGGGLSADAASSPEATNSIFWDDQPDEIVAVGSITVEYSDVEGGFAGTGNIDQDPVLIHPELSLDRASPCINRGDNASISFMEFDIYGLDRIMNGRADMGACEADDCILMGDLFRLDPRLADTVNLDLDFGPGCGGRNYIIAGSVSGSVPGFIFNGTPIPLNWDFYTNVVLANLNTPLFMGFAGTLDSAGAAAAAFNWPGGGSTSLIGLELTHAAFTFSPVDQASNPVPLFFRE